MIFSLPSSCFSLNTYVVLTKGRNSHLTQVLIRIGRCLHVINYYNFQNNPTAIFFVLFSQFYACTDNTKEGADNGLVITKRLFANTSFVNSELLPAHRPDMTEILLKRT